MVAVDDHRRDDGAMGDRLAHLIRGLASNGRMDRWRQTPRAALVGGELTHELCTAPAIRRYIAKAPNAAALAGRPAVSDPIYRWRRHLRHFARVHSGRA